MSGILLTVEGMKLDKDCNGFYEFNRVRCAQLTFSLGIFIAV